MSSFCPPYHDHLFVRPLNELARWQSKNEPEHAALKSYPQSTAPTLSAMRLAVAGKCMSAVTVAQMIRSPPSREPALQQFFDRFCAYMCRCGLGGSLRIPF